MAVLEEIVAKIDDTYFLEVFTSGEVKLARRHLKRSSHERQLSGGPPARHADSLFGNTRSTIQHKGRMCLLHRRATLSMKFQALTH